MSEDSWILERRTSTGEWELIGHWAGVRGYARGAWLDWLTAMKANETLDVIGDDKPVGYDDTAATHYLRSHIAAGWKVESIGYGWIILSKHDGQSETIRRWRLASSQPPAQEVLG